MLTTIAIAYASTELLLNGITAPSRSTPLPAQSLLEVIHCPGGHSSKRLRAPPPSCKTRPPIDVDSSTAI